MSWNKVRVLTSLWEKGLDVSLVEDHLVTLQRLPPPRCARFRHIDRVRSLFFFLFFFLCFYVAVSKHTTRWRSSSLSHNLLLLLLFDLVGLSICRWRPD